MVRRRVRALSIVVPITLAVLELIHTTWSESGLPQAFLAAGGFWAALHLLLLVGYIVLVWLLWVPAALPRILLVVFLVSNTAFIGMDGVGVGLLAISDPDAADRLWSSPVLAALANVTGAAWAASLLAVAAFICDVGRTRPALLGLGLTWLTFVASTPPLAAPSAFSQIAALATGAWFVFTTGASGIPAALLVFAAVLHQHVGAGAVLGILFVCIALARLPEHA
jgi:hypothetical protein